MCGTFQLFPTVLATVAAAAAEQRREERGGAKARGPAPADDVGAAPRGSNKMDEEAT